MFELIFLIIVSAYFIQTALFMIGAYRRFDKIHENELPTASVIVAARNEEENILACITALAGLEYPEGKLEIIIVDDDSKDKTYSIVSDFIKDKNSLAAEIYRILKKGGKFLLFFSDIFDERNYWYIYDFFSKTKEFDYSRFERYENLMSIFENAAFSGINIREIERIKKVYIGKEVFSDPFLKKHNVSQLAFLSDAEYQKGILNIKRVISENPDYRFKVEIINKALIAEK